MKKIAMCLIIVFMTTLTIGFCSADTNPNPPKGILPIGKHIYK